MANTYKEIKLESGYSYIEMTTESGEVFSIPKDESNSDYQAYLTKDEVQADEAKTK
jgi:hypothetical protein